MAPASDFTEAERAVLERYFTNLDRPVFGLRNLPEVVKGALFSRYSRTEKSLRRVLLDEFINDPESGFSAIESASPYDFASSRTSGLRIPPSGNNVRNNCS